ncbi:Histone lysine acetyltransferase CREBBP [Taenia solium]|eukprot:TsM_000337500 transcript=TsM_000337500 gene=TsM_000337500
MAMTCFFESLQHRVLQWGALKELMFDILLDGVSDSTKLMYKLELMANAKSTTRYQPATPIPTNPRFLQFQQQHLRLLLHAHCCHRDQMTSEGCTIPNCDEARSLLRHMEECRTEEDCERAYCTISKDLIAHWRKCKDEKCIVCAPVTFIPGQQLDQPDPIFTLQTTIRCPLVTIMHHVCGFA